MTDLENFRATTEYRTPGRILFYAGFTPDLQRRVIEHIGTDDIAGHYGFARNAAVGLRRPDGVPPVDYSKYWEGVDLPEGTTFAGGVAHVPGSVYHFTHMISPLRNAASLAEIENYPLDDLSTWDGSHVRAEVDKAHADGRYVTGWVGHMYESAWQIRGYEQFLVDLMERPSWAECLLERLHQQKMAIATALARGGVDCLNCGDDVANQKAPMFSPDLWRKLFHSRWRKVWRAVKDINPECRIWYHSDGDVTQLVPDMVDDGLDILNPVQPECVDVESLHKRFGDRLTFDGLIGTQSTMPWGTPDDVRARVREVIDSYGRNGGLIVSPTHVLEPEVPLANIDALCDECRRYGTF